MHYTTFKYEPDEVLCILYTTYFELDNMFYVLYAIQV